MELIVWRKEFDTGNDQVDKQHKHLTSLINLLFNTLGTHENSAQLKSIFLELYGYSVNHFSMEESLMIQHNYSKYENHKREHAQFALKIDDFKKKYLEGTDNINLDLLNYLKSWLINHIIVTDIKTFEEINTIDEE